jgi:hypothetical protein
MAHLAPLLLHSSDIVFEHRVICVSYVAYGVLVCFFMLIIHSFFWDTDQFSRMSTMYSTEYITALLLHISNSIR